MATAKAKPTGLIEALDSLRRILATAPAEPPPVRPWGVPPYRVGYDDGKVVKAWGAVMEAARAAGAAVYNADAADPTTSRELGELWNDIQALPRRPAPPATLRQIREMITDLGGEPSETSVQWSKADSPKRWAKRFNISPATFKRRVQDGTIRALILSDRLYQVDLARLPAPAKVTTSNHK
jgi:phytoene dehydrogenase-like protein